MKKPNPRPINPNTPRSKRVDSKPLPKLYLENMIDDVNTLEETNEILNKKHSNEDYKQNNSESI